MRVLENAGRDASSATSHFRREREENVMEKQFRKGRKRERATQAKEAFRERREFDRYFNYGEGDRKEREE